MSLLAATLLVSAANNSGASGPPAWDIADAAIWEAAARLLASAAIIAVTLVALSVVSLLMRFCTRSVLTISNVPRRHVAFRDEGRAQPVLSGDGDSRAAGVHRLPVPLERGRFQPRRPLRDRVHDAKLRRRLLSARLPRLRVGDRAPYSTLGGAADGSLRGGGWRRFAFGIAWHEHNSAWDAVDRLLRRWFTLTDSRVALFEHLLHAVVITCGLVAVLNIHGLTLWQLIVSFGMMTYLIAFSSNMIIENLICGLIMLFSEEVRMDDLVDPDGSGWVRIVDVGYIKTQVEDVNDQVRRILDEAGVTGRISDGDCGDSDDDRGADDPYVGDDDDDDSEGRDVDEDDVKERGIVLHHAHQQRRRQRRQAGESVGRAPIYQSPAAPRRRSDYLVKRWRNVPNSTFFKRTTTHLFLRRGAE